MDGDIDGSMVHDAMEDAEGEFERYPAHSYMLM